MGNIPNYFLAMLLQCPPLYRITLGQHKSDNNSQMIQLTDVLSVMLRGIMEPVIS